MKKIRTFFAAMAILFAATANAQSTTPAPEGADTGRKAWSNVVVSYNVTNFDIDMDVSQDYIHGVDFGYLYTTSLFDNVPLYLEGGLLANYTFGKLYDRYDFSISTSLLSLRIPVNVGYKVSLGKQFLLMPYAGVYLKGNLAGEMTVDYRGEDEDFDMFENDEGNGERIQAGMNVGLRCFVNCFTFGVGYGFDFNELMDDTECSNVQFSLGVCF